MSTDAISWAFRIAGLRSSDKFVLVALADCADAADMAWPSVKGISDKTNLDRKTVMKSLDNLEKVGLISDSGERKGVSKQVKIYHLHLEKDGVEPVQESPKNGTVEPVGLSTEASQKRDSPKNGTVPNFPEKSTKFPREEYQISHETVPNLGHGTIKEPLKNHKGTLNVVNARASPVDNPDGKKGKDLWWKSDKGIEKMGAKLGVQARPGESYRDWQRRIFDELDRREFFR